VILNLRGYAPGLTARHTERTWFTLDLSKGFSASAGERYLSRRSVDQFDHFFMGGFVTWDASVRYRKRNIEYRSM